VAVESTAVPEPADEYPVVGCYAHATHVAGIVGATADNAQGVRGMYAGVKMISVAMSRATIDTVGQCASHPNIDNTAASTNSLGYALDYVFWRVFNSQTTDVPIVTLSFNGGAWASKPTVVLRRIDGSCNDWWSRTTTHTCGITQAYSSCNPPEILQPIHALCLHWLIGLAFRTQVFRRQMASWWSAP
jgi:hypothetical protein